MENFKSIIFSLLLLFILGYSGYWAFSTMESGSDHVNIQKQKELEERNRVLEKEVADLNREVLLLKTDKQQTESKEAQDKEQFVSSNTTNGDSVATSNVYKYESLINELQKLIDSRVYLKNKSQGPAVGTIQKFFNVYNNTTAKIDNDYGLSTSTNVKNFQKEEGLTVDGETGPATYQKMIDWLKSH